jgi:hypothetical protein
MQITAAVTNKKRRLKIRGIEIVCDLKFSRYGKRGFIVMDEQEFG